MASARFNRILLKLSGEALMGELDYGTDPAQIERLQGSDANPAGDPSKQERPTTEWVTGEEPMTGPQASYLETLGREAGEEIPQPQPAGQAPHDRQGDQAEADREAGAERPQPPAPEPAQTQSGGDS